ncbi:hypothetical protein LTR05_006422 [Lithohypha guttulata]|uniref:SigF-like NTF2-like domain-containing protein n=1 Tax=Lithohypha guttulata TaxID=1690604 RepID=A0AAN7SYE0_9EURO|nr:hypothetical protein LTR05_006422 [Lithohypha guttulata]
MEDPVKDIVPLIHTLTQAIPSKQKEAVENYFTPNAAFAHPFCKTGSWEIDLFDLNSRWATLMIYQWYKILSPRIDLEVLSVTFNEDKLILYADIHQHFRLWLVPFYDADVRFTTCLHLAEGDETGPVSALTKRFENRYRRTTSSKSSYHDVPNGINGEPVKLYYITLQEDLYQTSEWIKFLVPWGVGATLVATWQFYATFFCILGSIILYPLTMWKEKTRADVPKQILPPRRFVDD